MWTAVKQWFSSEVSRPAPDFHKSEGCWSARGNLARGQSASAAETNISPVPRCTAPGEMTGSRTVFLRGAQSPQSRQRDENQRSTVGHLSPRRAPRDFFLPFRRWSSGGSLARGQSASAAETKISRPKSADLPGRNLAVSNTLAPGDVTVLRTVILVSLAEPRRGQSASGRNFRLSGEIYQRFKSPQLQSSPTEWNETFTESSRTVSEDAVKISESWATRFVANSSSPREKWPILSKWRNLYTFQITTTPVFTDRIEWNFHRI